MFVKDQDKSFDFGLDATKNATERNSFKKKRSEQQKKPETLFDQRRKHGLAIKTFKSFHERESIDLDNNKAPLTPLSKKKS